MRGERATCSNCGCFFCLSLSRAAGCNPFAISIIGDYFPKVQTPHLYLIPSPHKNLAIYDISASICTLSNMALKTCDIKIIIMVFIADNAIGMQC